MDPALLRTSGIVKSFGRRRVLDGITFETWAGEAVAIVGENSAGENTLLRICAGLERPDSGVVQADGGLGYCPQQPGLFDLLTADEHLALFAPALGLSREDGVREGRRLLGELGFPAGDRTMARRLSGGARQKLNLALALLGEPRVLLLDEPYQGFDHGAYVSFWDHMARWRADGLAVVIVTHLLADTTSVDRPVWSSRWHARSSGAGGRADPHRRGRGPADAGVDPDDREAAPVLGPAAASAALDRFPRGGGSGDPGASGVRGGATGGERVHHAPARHRVAISLLLNQERLSTPRECELAGVQRESIPIIVNGSPSAKTRTTKPSRSPASCAPLSRIPAAIRVVLA